MIKIFDSLLVPEWRKVITPFGFSDGVLRCVRTLCDRIACVIKLSLRSETTRPYYRPIKIFADTISYDSTDNAYVVLLNNPEIDVFGAALSDACAVIGRDFSRNYTQYRFKKHPSTYGITTTEGGRAVISFICIGGSAEDAFNPAGLPFYGATEEVERSAINNALYESSPIGITQDLITAAFGCRFSEEALKDTWIEGDTRFGLTVSNELVYAPTQLTCVSFLVGQKVDYSELLNVSDYFAAKLINGTFIFSVGRNTLSAIPNLLKNYPELTLYDDASFIGAELLSILRKRGCVFWIIPYIKSGINQTALCNYAVNPGKVSINGVVELESTNAIHLRQPNIGSSSYSVQTTSMTLYNCM